MAGGAESWGRLGVPAEDAWARRLGIEMLGVTPARVRARLDAGGQVRFHVLDELPAERAARGQA